MISVVDLDALAGARLDDAKVLFAAGRFDGAVYLCGYAIEIALKSRICRTLGWPDFPLIRREFEGLTSFRTHDLDILLRLSGQETAIKQQHFVVWNSVAIWNPEARYNPIGSATQVDTTTLMTAVEALLKVL